MWVTFRSGTTMQYDHFIELQLSPEPEQQQAVSARDCCSAVGREISWLDVARARSSGSTCPHHPESCSLHPPLRPFQALTPAGFKMNIAKNSSRSPMPRFTSQSFPRSRSGCQLGNYYLAHASPIYLLSVTNVRDYKLHFIMKIMTELREQRDNS